MAEEYDYTLEESSKIEAYAAALQDDRERIKYLTRLLRRLDPKVADLEREVAAIGPRPSLRRSLIGQARIGTRGELALYLRLDMIREAGLWVKERLEDLQEQTGRVDESLSNMTGKGEVDAAFFLQCGLQIAKAMAIASEKLTAKNFGIRFSGAHWNTINTYKKRWPTEWRQIQEAHIMALQAVITERKNHNDSQ